MLRNPAAPFLALVLCACGGGGGGGSSPSGPLTGAAITTEFTRGFAQFAGTPSATAAGDIDGDGRDDLIVVTAGADNEKLYVFYQRSNGPESVSVPTAAEGTRSVAVCDVDGDGKSEILVGYSSAALTIYKPGSDGRPVLSQTMAGIASSSVLCADLDGDGLADVITTGKPGVAMQVLLQRDGALVESGTYPGAPAIALDVGDVDGDGKAEVVASGSAIPGAPADFKGLAVAQLAPGKRNVVFSTASQIVITTQGSAPVSLPTAPNAGYVRVRDLNADGRADIVVFHDGAVGVYYQNADGSFASEQMLPTYPADPSLGAAPIAFGDFDGDGRLDLAVASQTAVTLFFQDVSP